jgi:hypothetical protein
MNHRLMFLVSICIAVIVLIAGCLSESEASIPITGGLDASVPVMVGSARDTVLEYVTSSTRLAAIPSGTEWQLDGGKPVEGEYRFRSSDWLMIVQMAENSDEDQQVMIINQIGGIYWCGCVHPDSTVMETSLLR